MDLSSQETEVIDRLQKRVRMTPDQATDLWHRVKHLDGTADDKFDAAVDLIFKANTEGVYGGDGTKALPGEPGKPQAEQTPPPDVDPRPNKTPPPKGAIAAAMPQGKKKSSPASAEAPEPEQEQEKEQDKERAKGSDVPPPRKAGKGDNGNGKQETETDEIHIELYLVEKLEPKLPPILTQGELWRVYQDGIWASSELCRYHREALEIIPKKLRTERLAKAVLRHIQGKHQLKESPFCGAYKFDGKDILICVANGVLRIHPSGYAALENYSPDHYFTQKLAAPFDPKADPKAFRKALGETLPDPKDRYLFGMFNASVFVPDCRWEASLCCYGETGTGKSTLVEGIVAMHGKGPCQALSLTQLCDPESYKAYELEFAMLNFSTELNALELTSERFKQLVSGEIVSVRPIYRAPYDIRTTCKFAFLTNHLPRFKDGSGAELRRLYFIKFAQIPDQKNLELKKEVAKEGAGILNLLVRLIPDLLKLEEMPYGGENSKSTRQRFTIANDPVGTFVQSECLLDREAKENKDRMQNKFKDFLSHHGLSDRIANSFLKQLYERFNVAPFRPRVAGGRENLLIGIELKPVMESQI
jgi:P4 family phage/plasmid primase-like protien